MKIDSARVAIAGMLILGFGLVPLASAFSGVLNSTDLCLLGTGSWMDSGPTGIKWDVVRNVDGSWHYAYKLGHPGGATRDFILEMGLSFEEGQIFNTYGDFDLIDVGWQSIAQTSPDSPASLYGIRFGEAYGNITRVEFDSYLAPTWGDFYAAGDQGMGQSPNSAWNAGLTARDYEPHAPARNGSVGSHVLVPNAIQVTTVPEPSSLLLLGAGLLGAFALRRKLS